MAMFIAFTVLFINGISLYIWDQQAPTNHTRPPPPTSMGFLPNDFSDFARFFGVASFSFGVPPLAFPIQGSMARPDNFRQVTGVVLALVALFYIILAEGLVLLYGSSVHSNIIEVSPFSHLMK